MLDLYLGLAIMTLLMGGMFALARSLTHRTPRWVVDTLAATVVVAIGVYARFVWDEPFVARLLPFSNLIIVSNWLPLAAGLLAGFVWQRIGDEPAKFLGLGSTEFSSTPRKVLAASVLFLAGFLSLAWPLSGQPPVCGNDWQGDICLQTTDATCSAAAGATLLQNYGVYASEQEMADLCLTRRGTSWKGLYRALALKSRPVGLRVDVAELTSDDLIEQFDQPCILQCELQLANLGDDFEDDIGYQMEGWVPGQPHSLVLLDVIRHPDVGDQFLIADPTNFVEVWTRDDLERLWHGQVIRLVPREKPVPARD